MKNEGEGSVRLQKLVVVVFVGQKEEVAVEHQKGNPSHEDQYVDDEVDNVDFFSLLLPVAHEVVNQKPWEVDHCFNAAVDIVHHQVDPFSAEGVPTTNEQERKLRRHHSPQQTLAKTRL